MADAFFLLRFLVLVPLLLVRKWWSETTPHATLFCYNTQQTQTILDTHTFQAFTARHCRRLWRERERGTGPNVRTDHGQKRASGSEAHNAAKQPMLHEHKTFGCRRKICGHTFSTAATTPRRRRRRHSVLWRGCNFVLTHSPCVRHFSLLYSNIRASIR